MINAAPFKNLRLRGGFLITEIQFTHEPLVDALGRQAAAQTRIVGKEFRMVIRAGLSERELSVTLYHEILEAVAVASLEPPATVLDFNEGDFEQGAQRAHEQFCDAISATGRDVAVLRFSWTLRPWLIAAKSKST